jgi:hypothetical protein
MVSQRVHMLMRCMLFIGIIVANSCTYYTAEVRYPVANNARPYQAQSPMTTLHQLQTYYREGRVLLLHSNQGIYRMRAVETDTLNALVYCTPELVDSVNALFADPYHSKGRYRIRKNEQIVLHQVHVFVDQSATVHYRSVTRIPATAIVRIDQFKSDKARNTLLQLGVGFGVTGAMLVTFVVIAVNNIQSSFNWGSP